MSRTFKDKPSKLKYDAWDKDRLKVVDPKLYYYTHYIWEKTTKTKKKKRSRY